MRRRKRESPSRRGRLRVRRGDARRLSPGASPLWRTGGGPVSDDFHRLVHDLGSAAQLPIVGNYVAAAVERTALEVKDGWNGKLFTDGHAKLTGRSITYDMVGAGLSAEIGAVRGRGKQAGGGRPPAKGPLHKPPPRYGAPARPGRGGEPPCPRQAPP